MQLNASSKICNFMLLIFCCSFNPFPVLLLRERERERVKGRERERQTDRDRETVREAGRAVLKCEKQTSKQTCKIKLQ